MKKVILLLLPLVCLGLLVPETASSIEIYTFRRERVDQELKGNRGYIMGTPPPVEDRGSRKRTLIGVDIELPFAEPGRVVDEETKPVREEAVSRQAHETVVSSPVREPYRVSSPQVPAEEAAPKAEKDVSDALDDGWIDDDWIK